MSTHQPSDLAAWCHGEWRDQPTRIQGFSIDTRASRPGDLFIALKGQRADGHAFVAQAFERGAAGAVVEKTYARPCGAAGPLLAVDDTRRALQDMARGYRASLRNAEFIAIAGSVGKTTVKEMLADVLGARGPTARTIGNWNNNIGLPLSILAMKPTDKFGVFEVGINSPGEMESLSAMVRPTHGVMTRIGPAHLEFFEGVEQIADEKAKMFEALPVDGVAVQSSDDPWHRRMSRVADCRMITVSMNHEAHYVGQTRGLEAGHFRVCERASGETADFHIPAEGDFIVEDALLAIAFGRNHGMAWDELRQVVKNYKPLPMRWTHIDMGGIDVVNDAYNANPMSMRASLSAFSGMKADGRKWLVLGGMRELGGGEREEHIRLGGVVASGDWAGLISTGTRAVWIADGAENHGFHRDKIFCCDSPAEAAEWLERLVSPGDAVLLKGSRGERLEMVVDAWRRIKHPAPPRNDG